MLDDETRQLDAARRRLHARWAEQLDPAQVDAAFAAVIADFEDVPVRAFVPLLAQRRADEQLRELTRS